MNIICISEERYYHRELELFYHDSSNGWTFESESAWKNSINATIRGIKIVLSPRTLKSVNNQEKIQLGMMCARFYENSCPIIVSFYCPNHVNDVTDITIFYNELSSLVWQISKDKILIIGGDMNTHKGKDGNNKLCLHNSPNRNSEHLA